MSSDENIIWFDTIDSKNGDTTRSFIENLESKYINDGSKNGLFYYTANLKNLLTSTDNIDKEVKSLSCSTANQENSLIQKCCCLEKKHIIKKIIPIDKSVKHDHMELKFLLEYCSGEKYNSYFAEFLFWVKTDINLTYGMILYDSSLEKYLRAAIKLNRTVKTEKLDIIHKKVLENINTLHTLGYIHRDIKPANILYNKNFSSIVLTDFELLININEFIKTIPDLQQRLIISLNIGTNHYMLHTVPNKKQFNEIEFYKFIDLWAWMISLCQFINFNLLNYLKDINTLQSILHYYKFLNKFLYTKSLRISKIAQLNRLLSDKPELNMIITFIIQIINDVDKYYIDSNERSSRSSTNKSI